MIYAALYADPRAHAGAIRLLACPAWHGEGDYWFEAAHRLAAGVAVDGGAGIVFHWPGHGESDGDPRELTMEELVAAGIGAADELLTRCGVGPLAVAGVRVGAVPAVLVARGREADTLLLVEPDLEPDVHFAAIERSARRTSLGRPLPPDWAAARFVPRLLRATPPPLGPLPTGSTGPGRCGVVRYEASDPFDRAGVDEMTVPGTRRRRSPDHHAALCRRGVAWLVGERGDADG